MTEISRGIVNKFNRGEISPRAFAREDVERLANSGELMTNFLPLKLGPMAFRPGFEYLADLTINQLLVPFISSEDDTALLVFTGATDLGFVVDGSLQTASGNSTTITNGNFSSLTGWTDDDEGLATSVASGLNLLQTGTGTDAARIYQSLTVTASNVYDFRIEIIDGPVRVKFGIAGDDGTYFDELLDAGSYWISVTPTTTSLVVTFSNHLPYTTRVDQIVNDTTGNVAIGFSSVPSPFDVPTASFPDLRWDQSVDELYFDGKNILPFIVRRYGDRSWGIALQTTKYGPYDTLNTSEITVDPNSGEGDTTLTASNDLFPVTQNGFILRYAVPGQVKTATGSTDTVETEGIFVFGTGDARIFNVDITVNSGTYTSIDLEKSYDNLNWTVVKSYTSGTSVNEDYNDGLDGVEIYYRLVVNVGAGANVTLTLDYSYGVVEGHFRAENLTTQSATTSEGFWYVDPGNQDAVVDYYLGSWRILDTSPLVGTFPTAVAFFEGRLWHGGFNKFWGSESDNYQSHDRTIEGASAAIQKTIGFGTAEQVLWMAGTDYLFAGLANAEIMIRSSSLNEPLTQDNTNPKKISTVGSAPIRPVVLDDAIVHVKRGKKKLTKLSYNGTKAVNDDLNIFHYNIASAGIKRVEVVRSPDTRLFVLLDDNTLLTVLFEEAEDVLAWSRITTRSGDTIEDICVLPSAGDDELYIVVSRSGGQRQLERMASLDDAIGGSISYHYDSWEYHASPGTSITGMHFAQNDVVKVWVDGVYDGDFTVGASGNISGITSGTNVVVGFGYVADFNSNKLTDYAGIGVLGSKRRIINTGLIMRNYVAGSVTIGPDSASLKPMPALEDGKAAVSGSYDHFPFEYEGESETDPRVYIQADGPCEIMALIYNVKDASGRDKRKQADG